MLKIKHQRTADCVVAGFRWHKSTSRRPDAVGSLLLGLYDDAGVLHHVGVTSSFTHGGAARAGPASSRRFAATPSPTIPGAAGRRSARRAAPRRRSACPARTSRWSAGKDLSWEPLRPERVCEVRYDHLQGDRFRHATTFVRWRPDKPPGTAATTSSRSSRRTR